MFKRKRTIVFEIVENGKQNSVKVVGVFRPNDFVKLAIAEILVRTNGNFVFFVQSTKKEIKKLGFQKIFEKAEKERFNAAKDALQNGELKGEI